MKDHGRTRIRVFKTPFLAARRGFAVYHISSGERETVKTTCALLWAGRTRARRRIQQPLRLPWRLFPPRVPCARTTMAFANDVDLAAEESLSALARTLDRELESSLASAGTETDIERSGSETETEIPHPCASGQHCSKHEAALPRLHPRRRVRHGCKISAKEAIAIFRARLPAAEAQRTGLSRRLAQVCACVCVRSSLCECDRDRERQRERESARVLALSRRLAQVFGITMKAVRDIWTLRTWGAITRPFWNTEDLAKIPSKGGDTCGLQDRGGGGGAAAAAAAAAACERAEAVKDDEVRSHGLTGDQEDEFGRVLSFLASRPAPHDWSLPDRVFAPHSPCAHEGGLLQTQTQTQTQTDAAFYTLQAQAQAMTQHSMDGWAVPRAQWLVPPGAEGFHGDNGSNGSTAQASGAYLSAQAGVAYPSKLSTQPVGFRGDNGSNGSTAQACAQWLAPGGDFSFTLTHTHTHNLYCGDFGAEYACELPSLGW